MLILLAVAFNVRSEIRHSGNDRVVVNSLIEDFIDCHLNSNPRKLNTIMEDNAVVKFTRNNKLITHSKADVLKLLKSIEGVKQTNCQYEHTILFEDDCIVLVRVDFKYPSGIQQNFLSLEKTQDKWKIVKVYRTYKNTGEV